MTLVIAMANDSLAVLLADRRITYGQQISAPDDEKNNEFNKVTVLFCNDARLSIAFTGCATVGNFNTSIWIAETLYDICKTTQDIHPILDELQKRAGQTFAALKTENKRLTIILCGFIYGSERPEPRVFVISNFENHPQHNPDIFIRRSSGSPGQKIVEIAGQSNSIPAATIETLRNLLSSPISPSHLVRYSVTHLQNAAKHCKTIGQHCTAAIVPATINTPITTTYHTVKNSNRAYGPNIVIAQDMMSLGSEMMSSSILAGPDIRKNDLCWCDSGEKFKHCHMKKYGGVYSRLPPWKKPLTCITQSQHEQAWACGNIFCVQGGYA